MEGRFGSVAVVCVVQAGKDGYADRWKWLEIVDKSRRGVNRSVQVWLKEPCGPFGSCLGVMRDPSLWEVYFPVLSRFQMAVIVASARHSIMQDSSWKESGR